MVQSNAPAEVYLEPEVLQALTEFYKRCSQPENN